MQLFVQRAIAVKCIRDAKLACLVAGVLKLTPIWLIVFPGMVARILFPDIVACVDPVVCSRVCGRSSCSEVAYALLVTRLMPSGGRGVMLAVMMSGLVSTLTSIYNSAATIFTMDIWKHVRMSAGEFELMIVGRYASTM